MQLSGGPTLRALRLIRHRSSYLETFNYTHWARSCLLSFSSYVPATFPIFDFVKTDIACFIFAHLRRFLSSQSKADDPQLSNMCKFELVENPK